MHTIRLSIAAILLSLVAVSAQAMTVTWTFQNAFFGDGATLTGSFDYGMGAYSNVSVTTSNGVLGGQDYDSVIAGNESGFISFAGGTETLMIGFFPSLTSGANAISILGGESSFSGAGRLLNAGGQVVSNIASTALPEPGTFVMFAIGLVAVFGLRRRAII